MTAKRSKKKKKGVIKLLSALFLISCSILLIIGITGYAFIKDAPQLKTSELENAKSSVIYDMNGEEVATISGNEHRLPVKIEDVPLMVQQAFLAVEDARFREHSGIDIQRIGGAILANIQEGWGAEGGSTITQQVVKNTYLTAEKTLKRKAQEAYLALKMEEKYSKDKILEIYLNKIYFGHGAYGLGAAADVYFNKKVEDLTVEEAALLAGLPQRPSGYDPFNYPENAKNRRDTVLSLMAEHNFISQETKEQAQSISIKDSLHNEEKKQSYQYFIDHVVEELIARDIPENEIFTGGLKIYTTLDPNAQAHTERVMTGTETIPFPDDNFKAGVILLDTKSGAIRAIGGERNPKEQDVKRGFNYATHIQRQPGSTVKPILDYGPAIEFLQHSTYHQIKDEEIEINGKTFKNYDDEFHGMVSMREALVKSYNIPAIKTFMEIEKSKKLEFASKLGIDLEHAYPAYAIGGFGDEDGVSPLDMAGAYAAFGNQGTYHEPYSVTKIVYPSGESIEFQPEAVKAMEEHTAYMITDMLVDVVQRGTGRLANIEGLPLAGKTGTTNPPEGIEEGSTDSWFVGYTTEYTAAVWTGYPSTSTVQYVTKQDARIARLLFKEIMAEVSKDINTEPFAKPATVKEVDIDKRNGRKASAYTPESSIITELFVEGTTLPTAYVPRRRTEESNNNVNVSRNPAPKKDTEIEEPSEENNEETNKDTDEEKEETEEKEKADEKQKQEETEKEENDANDVNDSDQSNNNSQPQKEPAEEKDTSEEKGKKPQEDQGNQKNSDKEEKQEKKESTDSDDDKAEVSEEPVKQEESNTTEDDNGTDGESTEKKEPSS
ncbi:penicillin-binding protein 1A [Gracilibacillus ureilyticus]|uniref:Penicillin-binding protein 1A n=1 Tax=Gracilibacillus ureilyticus TaxID=531814 RepID=A0A1H9UKV7_9BACI|nr:PBP1A family penicillin-binding protein [Gracilibacillus ureilyticus]SES09979.1 penicillin-binding protein 1A [Gracilibacillus ureilyticus]